MRALITAIAAAACVVPSNALGRTATIESKSSVAHEIAQILFPQDQLALLSTSGGKDWAGEVIQNNADLSKFDQAHPGFRELFRAKFDQVIKDALVREAPGFYDEVANRIDSNFSAANEGAALEFLRSSGGTKIVRFMHDSVRRDSTQSRPKLDINKLLTPSEQRAVNMFDRNAASKIMSFQQYDPATGHLIDRAFTAAAADLQKAVDASVAAAFASPSK
jgi:hypothetical protein